jgi:predicted DNA-binding transcriptional regulator AlpA
MTTATPIGEVLTLPAVLDLPQAGRILGIGRTSSYKLAERGEFPCRILRFGNSIKVPTADLLAVLGIPVPHPPATGAPPGSSHTDTADRPALPEP